MIVKKIEHKCELCKRAIADKTNSHIVPSFIICRTASSDGSRKRNHELVYSIGKTIQAYSGNEVPLEVMERNFDDLSDERINEELKKNTLSKDFVFCSSCEKALADYLESPYSSSKKIDAKTAYFFWLSIIWRVNHFELLSSNMPKFILSDLRKSLDSYLQARKKRERIDIIPQKYPFNYSILTCKDYSIDGDGCIYAEYDKTNRIFSVVLGDSIVCCYLKNKRLPDAYDFLGLRNELIQAPLNDGNRAEECRIVSKSVFSDAYRNLLDKAKIVYLNNEVDMIHHLWNNLKKRNYFLPAPQPSPSFIYRCLEIIHSDEKKVGEKYNYHNFAASFSTAMTEVYGIKVKDDSKEQK